MRMRLLALGILLWAAGTVIIRFAGHHFLDVRRPALTVALYAVSFAAMALLVRFLCSWLVAAREEWPRAALLLVLPTLLLDPFSSLFAAALFPNLGASGVIAFGGWMLMCCGGGLAGVAARRAV